MFEGWQSEKRQIPPAHCRHKIIQCAGEDCIHSAPAFALNGSGTVYGLVVGENFTTTLPMVCTFHLDFPRSPVVMEVKVSGFLGELCNAGQLTIVKGDNRYALKLNSV